jgi:hypothetical protein
LAIRTAYFVRGSLVSVMSEEIRVGWLGGHPRTTVELNLPAEELLGRMARLTSRSILDGGPLFPDRPFIGSIKGHTFKVRPVARSREMVPTLRGSVEATQAGSRLTFRVRPPLLFLPMMLMVTGGRGGGLDERELGDDPGGGGGWPSCAGGRGSWWRGCASWSRIALPNRARDGMVVGALPKRTACVKMTPRPPRRQEP